VTSVVVCESCSVFMEKYSGSCLCHAPFFIHSFSLDLCILLWTVSSSEAWVIDLLETHV
jgi:hypothetical protein